jgi:hypothetical protein
MLRPTDPVFPAGEHPGLGCREYFALHLLAALVAAQVDLEDTDLVNRAVDLTDALVARLNRA